MTKQLTLILLTILTLKWTASQSPICWWSGCQPFDWAVRGCPNDTTENASKDCENGTIYQCCNKGTNQPQDNCWWTECQPSSWEGKGCPSNFKTSGTKECGNGTMSQCCDDIQAPPKPKCWWSGCQPFNWAVRGCPEKHVEYESRTCEIGNGTLFHCCEGTYNEPVDKFEDYVDYVKYLLLRSTNFSINPDKLRCQEIDPDKGYVITVTDNENQGFRMCDLCPNLPQLKLTNIFLNTLPFQSLPNQEFPDCFGTCSDEPKCVALSYDKDDKICYMFNHTVGKFKSEDGWETVLMTQPVNVIKNWTYSRHTSVDGNSSKTELANTFLECMQKCDEDNVCNIVSYSFSSKQCKFFRGVNDVTFLDLEYGFATAFHVELLHQPDDVFWRFVDQTDLYNGTDSVQDGNTASNVCPKSDDPKYGNYYFQGCKLSGGLGCDQSSGCRKCYYPEKVNSYMNDLVICPDSLFLTKEIQTNKLTEGLKACLSNSKCLSVDFDDSKLEYRLNDIEKELPAFTGYRFTIQFPNVDNGYHKILKRFSFLAGYDIDKIGSDSFFEVHTNKAADECSDLCIAQAECTKYSYSYKDRQCKLGSEHVSAINTKSSLKAVFVKKPKITAVENSFFRSPGAYLNPSGARETKTLTCQKDCPSKSSGCLTSCLTEYTEWCKQVSVERYTDKVICHFFSADSSSDEIIEEKSREIFTRYFNSNLTLDYLNSLPSFQENDFKNCFTTVNEQTSTSLATVESSGSSSASIRRKRNIFKKIGNFFKKVGETIVNTVKDTVKTVVQTVKKGAESIGKVFKGDFKGAKDAFMEIPIVKDVKNVVQLGGAIIKGDWKQVKERGLDLLDSSLIDMIPVAGKGLRVVGKTIKGIGKSLGDKAKDSVSRTAKKDIKEIEKKNRKTDSKRDADKDKPDNQRDKEREENRKRCKRAGKRKDRPGDDCDKDDEKDDTTCKRPLNVKDALMETFRDCGGTKTKRPAGSKCYYECEPGYDENPYDLTCKTINNKAVWEPNPNCKPEGCVFGPTPVIPINTPAAQKYSIPSLGKYITAYVLFYNKARKLPIWSVAYHQSAKVSYNKAKDFDRKGPFFQHPCLKDDQANDDIYVNTGYDRGHLTPANIARWSTKATVAINLYANIAPQDPYTNQQAWKKLESHIECFTDKKDALVATGLCTSSIEKIRGVDVPTCYWKMICYRDENNEHQVVGFYAGNKKVLYGVKNGGGTPQAKKDQRERALQIAETHSQDELAAKIGASFSVSPWLTGSLRFYIGRWSGAGLVGKSDPPDPYKCHTAKTATQAEKDLWQTALVKKLPTKGKGKRRRRQAEGKFRGCRPGEGKSLAALFGLSSLFLDDDEDFGIDEDIMKQRGGDGTQLVKVASCGKRIIGYYTSWGKNEFTPSQAQKLTHLVFAFLEITADLVIIIGSPDRKNSKNVNEETDLSRKRLQQVFDIASNYPHLKVMFAVGGWENSQYFSAIASSPGGRLKFISSIIEVISKWNFDGVDLDWEYPVTGGAQEGVPSDKQNYVQLMKELREALDQHAQVSGRASKYLISFAGAAGQWTLDPGFDLPGLLKYADFVNVMTYDFFGAWESKWGAYTGPPAPLFFAMPPRFSGKTNVAWTIKYYQCKSKKPHQVNMGLPFYGRFWKNVGDPVDPSDGMWRLAKAVGGKFEGGYASWKDIKNEWLNKPGFQHSFHEKAKTPYAFSASEATYLGYENPKSLESKVQHAVEKNVGGLMIWAIDQDDDDTTMLNAVYNAPLCDKQNPNEVNQKCSPIDEKRWWTSEDGDDFAGLCGRSAPLYKTYYPVCDPDDPGYSCCGAFGYCGSGEKYCNCPTCVDFGTNPDKITAAPIKPSVPVTWYYLNAADGKRGRCGKTIEKINGAFPTCNPDDPNAYCCSNGGYCGKGNDFCECEKCVDFKKNPSFKFE